MTYLSLDTSSLLTNEAGGSTLPLERAEAQPLSAAAPTPRARANLLSLKARMGGSSWSPADPRPTPSGRRGADAAPVMASRGKISVRNNGLSGAVPMRDGARREVKPPRRRGFRAPADGRERPAGWR